jgi:N,N'-diacetyllegionaminate synthase
MSVLIIAEAGVNHNGQLDYALELIRKAAEAGADIVKFQTFKAGKLVSRSAKKAAYQSANMKDGDDSQFRMLQNLEIPQDWYPVLMDECKRCQIEFLSTPFDEESADFLETLNTPLFKIPSGELTNKPFLVHLAKKNKPIILSTGMADMNEIKAALDVILANGLPKEKLSLLHCNTEYPTPFEDVNLLAMNHIQRETGVMVGYSDHTKGIEVPVAAVALGAKVIEKHFTLDRNFPGPDHAASLEPDELKAMVQAIRNIEKAISGSGIKQPSESEKPNIPVARKSLHLSEELKEGEVLTAEHLIALRPGDGISPMDIEKVIGKRVNRFIEAGTKLEWQHIEE